MLNATFCIVLGCLTSASAPASQPARVRVGDPILLDSGLRPVQVEQVPYRNYVRDCLDALMKDGTDRYGKKHLPILMNIIDVRDRTCPENPLPLDESVRVSRRERRGPAGGNLYPDQATYRTFLALSQITGDEQYADFARDSISHYVTHLHDDKGFIWWGWHRHYDAYQDILTGHLGNYHEFHIQQAFWPILWSIDAPVCRKEIEAIWNDHVINKTTGEINRHGDGKRGCDFAFSGGEILYAFAYLYSQDHEKEWLDRAILVANYYWTQRDPQTNLFPTRPNAGKNRFDGACFDTSTTGILSPRLLNAHELTGDTQLRDQALAYLRAYAQYGWDDLGQNFWASLRLDGTPVKSLPVSGDEYSAYQPVGHVDLWQPYAAGYIYPFHTAQAYAYAYELTQDERFLLTAKRWSEVIRRDWPPRKCNPDCWYSDYSEKWARHGTYAEHYGRTLSFMLQMYKITNDKNCLAFARTVAQEAVSKLYYKGLLRGHPCKPYYESIDGVGYLLYSLLQLDCVLQGAEKTTLPSANW